MKYSKQRELIKQTVLNSSHPTAEDVYLTLVEDNPQLSLGTVYRNLNTLCDKGVIKRVAIPNSKDYFDGILSEHQHLICDKCHNIFDLDVKAMDELADKIEKDQGIKVSSLQLFVKGVCHNCQKDID
ncbi:transcriptional repressor [Erysipelotrichaceae bacterium OttesenSCG-928-M19]|nr:transcriptional repressor [Erysipelotrichaceae bacterium OttesenSCG-928-M19]